MRDKNVVFDKDVENVEEIGNTKDVEDVNNIGNVGDVDETLLLVSGKNKDKEYTKKLANAILQVFFKHGSVRLRCVGAASVNSAIKSFIIAKNEINADGNVLYIDPIFTTVTLNGNDITGIIFDITSD